MTTGSVLEILIYVFDRYMLEEASTVPHREHLARDLEQAGFGRADVERALDWLTDLAFGQERARPNDAHGPGSEGAVRIFTDSELARLTSECRGLLLRLERAHVITALQRELVIERLLALEADEADTEQLKWVVLMVLSSEPDGELAVERLGGLIAELRSHAPH